MPELAAVMRGVIRTNIDLVTGGIGQISDGEVVGSTGATENWLLVGQNGGADNGPYTVTPLGVWTRHTEMDESAEFVYNKKIAVQYGITYGNSEWYLSSPSNPTLGTTLLDFKPRSFEVPREAGEGLQDNTPFIQLYERPGVAGTWINPIITITRGGAIEGVVSGAATQTALIEAMKTVYLSANSVRVEAGAIFVPGAGLLEFDAAVDKTGLVLTANTWYYLYAYSSEGLPQIEVSTQRPASPYRGEARMKGGPDNTTPDTSPSTTHRYIPRSAFRCGATANTILRFVKDGPWTTYQEEEGTTLRIFSGLSNTTRSVRSAASLVPPISRLCIMRIQTNGSSATEWDANVTPFGVTAIRTAVTTFPFMDLDASQQFGQRNQAASGASDFGVMAYYEGV